MHTDTTLNVDRADSWQAVDLTTLADKPRPQPNLSPNFPLAYPGSRVLVSAPPESVKSLLMYAYALDVLREGGKVAVIDFEMGEYGALRLLRDLGATDEEIRSIHFYPSPEDGLGVDHPRKLLKGARPEVLERLLTEQYAFVLIDAGLGAYSLEHIEDNKRDEFQAWAKVWLQPLWKSGTTPCLIDHEPKNGGRWAIGSERKQGEVDVHLRLETKEVLVRGGQGRFRVFIEKDRLGFIRELAPKGFELNVFSAPGTHALKLKLDSLSEEKPFRPTAVMGRVSRFVEDNGGCSRTKVREAVGAKNETVAAAIEILLDEGYIEERDGKRWTTLHHLQPYSAAADLGDDYASFLAGGQTASDHELVESA